MRRPAISLIATTAVLLALASPVLGLKIGRRRGRRRCRTTPWPSRGCSRCSATSPAARPSRSTSSSTARANDPRRPAGPDAPARRARQRPGLRRPRADGRDRAARRRGLRAAHRRAEQRTRVGRRSTACATTTCPPRSARQPTACSSAAAPAEARDSFAVNGGWLPIVIAFVLTLSFVLLTLAFRSIAIPLTAIAVNLLSVGAAYGILVLVFQKGVGDRPAGLHPGRAHRRVGADLPVQRAVRALDGLPGVPAQPHPRALERRPATPPARSSTASPPPRA